MPVRFVPASLLILSILISTAGCGHTPSVAPLPELGVAPPPAVFIEQRGAAPPGVVELGPACPAVVGDAPTAFFDDRVLVRLPPGVEGEQVPEQSPSFARSHSPIAMGCESGLAASVFVDSQRNLGNKGLAAARERLFSNLNFPDHPDIDVVDGSDEGDDISLVMRFPNHPVWGGVRVYLRMTERYGRIHTIGFLTEQRSYHQLEPLFQASATTLLIVPG
ncbi:hypothetical protein [Enhygromyxa salina]|uniref:Lipoprotein n=1 Tax=Enhygromyxa salina TaxID=215803 RepID=A0A2S9XQT5_9BACT|nr:hypothetical protein [Enhygromyxa salina]PRP95228.1 hypothetical protein ENSA7_75420 [Enhygromyxa salina]